MDAESFIVYIKIKTGILYEDIAKDGETRSGGKNTNLIDEI